MYLRLLAALFAVAVLAPIAHADPVLVEDNQLIFLRGEGCGADEDLYLDLFSGADGYDGCGIVGGLPLVEVLDDGPKSLSLRQPVEFTVDASRDLGVTIRAESWFGNGIPGVGQSNVTVSVRGVRAVGTGSVLLGSGTSELVTTADHALHEFTFDIDEAHQGLAIRNVMLEVRVHGMNVNNNNLGMEGDSFIDLPILVETTAAGAGSTEG